MSDQASADAVQVGLGAEHAAVWTYGLVSAFLPKAQETAVAEGANAHRARRDTTERWLRDAGQQPKPAAAAYLPPEGVQDAASSIAALVAVEADCCAAWRGVLERTDDNALRTTALAALTESAVRGTRWRRAAGLSPVSIALPGAPE
ncbi:MULTISPECIES: ferritin-like domain-containing protein [Actinosynnema]|uniref:ferritin-like domain-containing protein n=1 Tax=Actinosynnema TaxID=40566 RepID=UPI0020A24160|nr:ferritin-like domain-containing protein [Actinosynnema pretiosum]MCP2094054.1 protein of unknown function (DUF4439) [Actinosynnema pretiosum]